jgi:hypothetical protein
VRLPCLGDSNHSETKGHVPFPENEHRRTQLAKSALHSFMACCRRDASHLVILRGLF